MLPHTFSRGAVKHSVMTAHAARTSICRQQQQWLSLDLSPPSTAPRGSLNNNNRRRSSHNLFSTYATASYSSSATVSPTLNGSGSITAPTSNNNGGSKLARALKSLLLISTSATGGAFVYSKAQNLESFDMGGFNNLPLGKIQPTIFGTDGPPEEEQDPNNKKSEKEQELRSVLLEREMALLPIVQEYKDKVKGPKSEWKEADPYWFLTTHTQQHHLTAGSLRGENMLSVKPLKFEHKDKKSVVMFLHLGRSLCGHDGIIHGGLLGTLLDEATSMVVLPNLPFHIGFTANLNLNYRRPVKADQFVMIKAECEKVEGRKGYTNASIQDLNGNTLVECTALFVSPKNPVAMVANYVKNSLGFSSKA